MNVQETDSSGTRPLSLSSDVCEYEDIVRELIHLAGDKQYLSIALVSLRWRRAWGQCPSITSYATPETSASQLLYYLECGLPRDHGVLCRNIAGVGNLDLLQCARDNGCWWDESTCEFAAAGGHLGVLAWARGNGCPWDAKTCEAAARGGYLEVLAWAKDKGCPWHSGICREAATAGHVEIVRWARSNGCSWDMWTMSWAFKNGYLDLCSGSSALHRLAAVPGGHMVHIYQ